MGGQADGALQRGRAVTIEDLFREQHRLVNYIVRSRLGWGSDDAEDVVQNVWLAVVKHLPRFRHESHPKTWIKRIAINAALTWLRRARHRQCLSLDPSVCDPAVRPSETQLDLELALGTLPPHQRQVLLLHDAHGITHEGISRHLGIARCTSIRTLAKARGAMRNCLSESTRR